MPRRGHHFPRRFGTRCRGAVLVADLPHREFREPVLWILGDLVALGVDALGEVPVLVEQADTDQWHVEDDKQDVADPEAGDQAPEDVGVLADHLRSRLDALDDQRAEQEGHHRVARNAERHGRDEVDLGLRVRRGFGTGNTFDRAMAGRFPEADTVESFWRNLRDGRECIRTFTREELLEDVWGVLAPLTEEPPIAAGAGKAKP